MIHNTILVNYSFMQGDKCANLAPRLYECNCCKHYISNLSCKSNTPVAAKKKLTDLLSMQWQNN